MENNNFLITTRCGPPGLEGSETSITINMQKISQNINKSNEVININKKTNEVNKNKIVLRDTLLLATFNVRTLAEKGKLDELCTTASKYNIDFISIQEHRYTTDEEIDTINMNKLGYTFVYTSANNKIKNKAGGVGLLFNQKYKNNIKKYERINERILLVTLNTNPELKLYTIYAPTESSNKENKTKFYEALEKSIESNKYSLTIILGDFNAQIGEDHKLTNPRIIGNFTYHQRTNNNGKLMINFCENNSFRPIQTRFQHNKYRLWTWQDLKTRKKVNTNENHKEKTQIDHILIMNRWLSSIKNCRAYDTGSVLTDHRIVVAKLKISMKIIKENNKEEIDWEKLKDQEIRTKYNKTFSENYKSEGQTTQSKYNNFIKTINKANKLLPLKKINREPWISDNSLKLREIKNDILKTYTNNKNNENRKKLKKITKKIRKSYKKDKSIYFENIIKEIQEANERNDTSSMFKTMRSITGDFNKKPLQFKDKKGNLTANTSEILEIWKDYFKNLLNVETQVQMDDIEIAETELPIITTPFTEKELDNVLKYLKTKKAPGIDGIRNEVLKYSGKECRKILLEICNDIYKQKVNKC